MKLALAAAALASAHSPAYPQTNPLWHFADAAPAKNEAGIDPATHPEIVRVDCADSRGSAVKVSSYVLLTVAHVTDGEDCRINGRPIHIISKKGDFAVVSTGETFDRWLAVDCGGFVAGRKYVAIGFARGLSSQTSIDAEAMGTSIWGFYRLWGVFTVIPGMSGGGFIDEASGRLVGMVNVYDARRGDSGSVALKGTSVCAA